MPQWCDRHKIHTIDEDCPGCEHERKNLSYHSLNAIPEEWIKRYIDKLLELATKLDPGRMQDATLLRADHVMDLVKAWRESRKGSK